MTELKPDESLKEKLIDSLRGVRPLLAIQLRSCEIYVDRTSPNGWTVVHLRANSEYRCDMFRTTLYSEALRKHLEPLVSGKFTLNPIRPGGQIVTAADQAEREKRQAAL